MKTFKFILALCLVASAAVAQQLTWTELIAKPDLWPKECTSKKAVQFQSGKSVRAGQTMTVLEMHPNEIVLGSLDGAISFGAKPTDTDALEVANTAYAKLTPKQRELNYASVLKRPDLWPWRLTLMDSFDIGRQRLKKGDSVYLMGVEKGQLVVCPATFDTHFELDAKDTDIVLQARKYVDDPNGAPGRLVQELNGKLINAATGTPSPLNTNAMPRYYVIYHAARWCPYSQKFTPDLLKLYREMKEKHPEFEVIYVPADHTAAEEQLYAKEMEFPWPCMIFQQKQKSAVLARILGRSSTPELCVLDRHANILIDNRDVDRDEALKQLRALLEKPAAKL